MFADLTSRRPNILNFVKDQCKSIENGDPTDRAVNRVVDFVFADLNCKIKFKSRENKFYTINSEQEFLNLVYRLDEQLTVSDTFKADESNRINYHSFEEETSLNEIFY